MNRKPRQTGETEINAKATVQLPQNGTKGA
jgi:hypothetical protein